MLSQFKRIYHQEDYINSSKRLVKSKKRDCGYIISQIRLFLMDTKRIFAYNLKRLRQEKGITKKEIAKKLGVHWNTVNVWEKGQKFPRNETLTELAKILGVSVADFFQPPAPEPFPGFDDVMRLPARERYGAICYLVAQKYELEGFLQALDDPFYKDEKPVLETEEEVIQEYERQDKLWRERAKKFLSMEGVSPERQEAALRYLEEKFKVKIDREAIKEFIAYPKKEEKEES